MSVVQDGWIYIELINGPFLFREKGTPEEYKTGLDLAIERREGQPAMAFLLRRVATFIERTTA